MIFPGFPGVLSFFQVFQVEWEPCNNFSNSKMKFNRILVASDFWGVHSKLISLQIAALTESLPHLKRGGQFHKTNQDSVSPTQVPRCASSFRIRDKRKQR